MSPFAAVKPVLSIGLLGLGTVGSQVFRILTDGSAVAERAGGPLRVSRIAVARPEKERGAAIPRDLLTDDVRAVVRAPDVDIVVEVIGGRDPARGFVEEALAAGKPVVTANKQLMAEHGGDLLAIAERSGVDLCFEGSVGVLPQPAAHRPPGRLRTRRHGVRRGAGQHRLHRPEEPG